MNTDRKKIPLAMLALGAILTIYALILDLTGSTGEFRGYILILGVILLILGVFKMPHKKHTKIVNMVFLFPMVFTFAVTVIIPFILGIIYSFTDWNGIQVTRFVGFENYITMFKQSDYVYSFVITLIYTVINMVLVNVVGFVLALVCSSKIKGTSFFRSAYFLPNLIGGLVLGYVWQFIFNKVFTTIFAGSLSMLTDANLALLAILIVNTWQYAGYIMLIYLTGLQTVPKDVLEASGVDGASALTTLFKIKIPMIANTFTVCIFLTLVNSFKQFDLNLAITNGAPSRIMGPKIIQATELLALNIYNTAIRKNNYALGQTKAVVFFIILAAVSLTQVAISKKREVEL